MNLDLWKRKFLAAPYHEIENGTEAYIHMEQRRGKAVNVVKDSESQVQPPVLASWTGNKYHLQVRLSGRRVWIELQEFRQVHSNADHGPGPLIRVTRKSSDDREAMAAIIGDFIELESW